MTDADLKPLGKCPKCGCGLFRLWGYGWGWDHAMCVNRDCDYDVELDEMTGHNPDGSVWQRKKEKE